MVVDEINSPRQRVILRSPIWSMPWELGYTLLEESRRESRKDRRSRIKQPLPGILMCIGMLSEGSGLRRLLSVVVVLSMLSSEHIERLHSGQGVATMNGEDKRSS